MGRESRESIERLRAALRRRFPTAHGAVRSPPGPGLPTGIPALDEVLRGGGFLPGTVVEVAGAPSSGKTALALAAVAAATGGRALAAWIDGEGTFFAPTAAGAGIALDRLLVLRPSPGREGLAAALRAVDEILRSASFPLVVLDAGRHAAEIPGPALIRFERAARESRAVLIVLAECPTDGTPLAATALIRLYVERIAVGWEGLSEHAAGIGRIRTAIHIRKGADPPRFGCTSGNVRSRLPVHGPVEIEVVLEAEP